MTWFYPILLEPHKHSGYSCMDTPGPITCQRFYGLESALCQQTRTKEGLRLCLSRLAGSGPKERRNTLACINSGISFLQSMRVGDLKIKH